MISNTYSKMIELTFPLRLMILGSVFLLLNLISRLPFVMSGKYSICLFHQLTGQYCPGCGLTRSILHISQGNFQNSLFLNPFGILLTSLFMLFLLFPKPFRDFWTKSSNAIYTNSKPSNKLLLGISLSTILVINFFRERPF